MKTKMYVLLIIMGVAGAIEMKYKPKNTSFYRNQFEKEGKLDTIYWTKLLYKDSLTSEESYLIKTINRKLYSTKTGHEVVLKAINNVDESLWKSVGLDYADFWVDKMINNHFDDSIAKLIIAELHIRRSIRDSIQHVYYKSQDK